MYNKQKYNCLLCLFLHTFLPSCDQKVHYRLECLLTKTPTKIPQIHQNSQKNAHPHSKPTLHLFVNDYHIHFCSYFTEIFKTTRQNKKRSFFPMLPLTNNQIKIETLHSRLLSLALWLVSVRILVNHSPQICARKWPNCWVQILDSVVFSWWENHCEREFSALPNLEVSLLHL